jgi:hypothetical protein
MRTCLRALLFAAALLTAACSTERSSGPGTTPTPTGVSFTGTWSGDLIVQGAPARMTWTLNQSGTAVNGTVLVGLASGTVLMNGLLTGMVSGSTMAYTITVSPGGIPTLPSCTGQLGGNATTTEGSPATISGSYNLINSTCASPLTGGSFVLTKRS